MSAGIDDHEHAVKRSADSYRNQADRGGRAVLGGFLVVLAAAVFPMLPGAGGRPDRVEDWIMIVPATITLALAARAARSSRLDPELRRAWRLVIVAIVVLLATTAVWRVAGSPALSAYDFGFFTAYCVLLTALTRFPSPLRDPAQRHSAALNAVLVTVGGYTLIWAFVLGPVAERGGSATVVQTLVAALWPVGDLMLLFFAILVLANPQAVATRRAVACIAVAALLQFSGNVSYSVAALASPVPPGFGAADLLWCAAYLMLGWAAWIHRRDALLPGVLGPPDWALAVGRGLPYAALAVSATILLWILLTHGDFRVAGLLLGASLLIGITAVRQAVSGRQLAGLRAQAAAQQVEARFRALVQNSQDIVAVTDLQGRTTYVSPSIERILGVAPDEVVGRPVFEVLHPEDADVVRRGFVQLLRDPEQAISGVYRVRNRAGEWVHLETVGANHAGDPAIEGVVLNARDVSERVDLEAQLSHQAMHDALTGLPNRALFGDRLRQAVARDTRVADGVAVLFLDLDHFKTINDTLGHEQGDLLLQEVARRLLDATRGSDTVARLAGDEFAILLGSVATDERAAVVARRVIAGLKRPILLAGREVHIGVSIGIARNTGGESADQLVRNADAAMYHAKAQGRGDYAFFRAEMREAIVIHVHLREEMIAALSREPAQFRLVYQPVVDLRSRRINAVEALVRWDHPQRGVLAPAEFIPIAERSGLIVPLGELILTQACRQWVAWTAEGAADVTLAVNISTRQLREPGFAERVRTIAAETGMDPRHLLLEITEGIMMEDSERSRGVMRALKSLGIRLAIDDFGTGYSSLAYLQRFPVDVLKIDRAFIRGMERGGSSSTLARVLISLGEQLGLETVAEGIETAEELDCLLGAGCATGQGFFLSHPVPAHEITPLLRRPTAA